MDADKIKGIWSMFIILLIIPEYCFLLSKIGNEMKAVKSELKKKRSLLQMDELKCRKRVLRRLGYVTASDVIEIKGRVACEISR